MAEYEFSKRFDVPEAARKRAQQWINMNGPPNALVDVLDGLDIELTDKQVQSLYNSVDASGKEWLNKSLSRIRELEEKGSRQAAYAKKRYERELIAHALGSEYHDAVGKYIHSRPQYNYNLRPRDIWPKGKQKTLADALRNIRKFNEEAALAAEKKAKADRIRKIGMKTIKGGKTGLKMIGAIPTPVTAALGALGWAMDAKDAYALTESTLNPKTEQDMARQRMLAETFRRNEIP